MNALIFDNILAKVFSACVAQTYAHIRIRESTLALKNVALNLAHNFKY